MVRVLPLPRAHAYDGSRPRAHTCPPTRSAFVASDLPRLPAVHFDPQELFAELLRVVAQRAGAQAASLWFGKRTGSEWHCVATLGVAAQAVQSVPAASGSETAGDSVARLRLPLVSDLVAEVRVHGAPEELRQGWEADCIQQCLRDYARALPWAYALHEALRQTDTLLALVAASRELACSLELREVLDRVASQVRRTLKAKLVSILLEHEGFLELAAADGAPCAYLARGPLPIVGSIAGKVLQSGMPVVIPDVRREPGFLSADIAAREGLCTLVCLPLRSRQGNLGVLNVYSAEPRSFRPRDIEVLSLLAQLSAAAIENASLYRQAVEAGEHLREAEKLAALGRLSAGLAHEIKNPLNTIAVLSYAMWQQAAGNEQAQADLHVIESEVRRLVLLVDQFLDFARPRPPEFRRHDVAEIVEETLMLVRAQAARERVQCVWRVREQPALVWADGAQLKQVFLNLVLNAVQAMSGGGTLRVAVQRRRGGVAVEFADTGPGISPQVRRRIFEPFFTTRRGGHGLGLAISLRIVENHSGRLWLDSAPGQGTKAIVWLPE